MLRIKTRYGVTAILFTSLIIGSPAMAAPILNFQKLWTYDAGNSVLDSYADQGVTDFDLAPEAEIVSYDTASERFFVINGREKGVDVLDKSGVKIATLDTSVMGSPNSVAVKNGVVAVAVENSANKQDAGEVWFFDAATASFTRKVTVGALPDMVTFTPDGSKLLVANEGEPNDSYTNDPNGTVTVIDLSTGVASATATHLGFGAFSEAAIEADGGRVFGNNNSATVSQDLEPEYITVSPDGKTAFVTLQENNAVAKIDLTTNTITEIQGLGYKDYTLPGNEFDASDKDGINGNLQNWNVMGMYQPDAIDSYVVNGNLYYVTANEGDARDYSGYSEEVRVKDLALDLNNNNIADSDADDTDNLGSPGGLSDGDFLLQKNGNLGRLKTTTANGDSDGDGLTEQIYSFGARSFSIWDENGNQVYDSGNLIEQILANQYSGQWADGRSDDKGPEPESITIAQLGQWMYALVGLERTNGVMIFDITDPTNPLYQSYIVEAGDLSPEGLLFVSLGNLAYGSGGYGYVAVANEGSGTTTLYSVSAVPVPGSLALFGLGMLVMRRYRR
ncbi:choice-of-anchor I family protein [Sedimenticola selenatireducens]|uniref:Alkaline phosphatase n=1 Tax=Sedimenticola selenatireducens TaxID=191960 RepID=A0A558DR28_9GAMM|nr:choice-of-anchor I family protein [Sedimenticola selenatireducens]TVO73539.1 alkaline phosphatase [Sedimenticola selenatireducens]TVT63480.1 MAG: alkaline phosphatase [Sedimenticola selenatireducens]